MARFKFELEAALKHRMRQEDLARLAYIEAQRAVDAQNEKIRTMYQRADEVRAEIAASEKLGTAHAMELVRASEFFLNGHRRRIEDERREAGRLLKIRDETNEALMLAARETKVLEKLREKRRVEFFARLDRMEAAEMDDLATTRQAWGKK